MSNPHFPGMQEVGERIRRSAHVLLGLDYDGTLTPIVDEPAEALLSAPMREIISVLSQRDDVAVAVISGRSQRDLQQLVGISGVIYGGNHGMEINGPALSFIEPGARVASQELHALGQEIAKKLRHIQGAFVEDKGLTLSVHHRRVAPVDGEEVWHAVHDVVAPHRDRFHCTRGAKVYEVRPLVRWNKGSAVAWIREQLNRPDSVVIYIGDDTTDEDAFRTLDEEAVTIRVGDSAETGARFLLAEPATVQNFLQWLNELRT